MQPIFCLSIRHRNDHAPSLVRPAQDADRSDANAWMAFAPRLGADVKRKAVSALTEVVSSMCPPGVVASLWPHPARCAGRPSGSFAA